MDAAPRSFAELPREPGSGLPVPFACGTDAGAGTAELDGRRVTQCALSRVCGVCGAGLGRPIAFLGSRRELDRNSFHFPPSHPACAEALRTAYDDVEASLLGQPGPVTEWVLVTTAAFEFVRAGRDEVDRRPTFEPHALLSGVP